MPRAPRPSTSIFATTPYLPDGEGVLRACLPVRCVFAAADESCSVYVDHVRVRKTGPRFPIAVVSCRTHPGQRYTLYPPGYFLYGRQPVAVCSTTGPLLLDGESGQPAWEGTIFRAACDADREARWYPDSPADDDRRRRTQGRHLELAGRLLGVHPELDERARERVATWLDVPLLTLSSASRRWSVCWTSRGRAVAAALSGVPVCGLLPDRLLEAGAVAQLWARPRRWDPARRTWVLGPLDPVPSILHAGPRRSDGRRRDRAA